MLAQAVLAIAIFNSHAQINGSDPSLVLWLKASTITPGGITGFNVPDDYVTNWVDSSTYGTIFVPPQLPPADTGTETNRTPTLVTVTNNGDVFPAVEFLQAYDPLTGGNGTYADRLWQTNNLDANDPTLIPPTSDITLFFVYENNAPGAGLGPSQCIFSKRGPSACPYEFALQAAPNLTSHMFITYAGNVAYPSANGIPKQPEWGIIEMNATAAGVLTFKQYYQSLGGWLVDTQAVARGGGGVGTPCTFSFHTQGAGGTAGNPWGNGAYERFAGEVAEVALYNRSLSSNELSGIESSLLLKYFLQPGPPTFFTEPVSQTIVQFSPVTFTVLPNGTPPFTYQWLYNGSPIPGANGTSYTISSVQVTNAGAYSVIVSNSISFATSTNAVLTVKAAPRPTVISALRDYTDDTYVTVTYSEPVDITSATNVANYSINGGVTISDAVAVTNSVNSDYTTNVVLTTSGVTTAPAILSVTNVLSEAGVAVATNTRAIIPIPGPLVGSPPSTNLLLWIAGDNSIYAEPGAGLLEWGDQSPNQNNIDYAAGAYAQVGSIAFPNGMHPCINFDGNSAYQAQTTSQFSAMTNFTFYVVGDVDNTKTSVDWVGDWSGVCLGISDSSPGVIKWVTYQPNGGNDTLQPPPSDALGNRVPYFVEGSFVNYGQKSLYIDGNLVATEASNSGVNIVNGAVLTIGALAIGAQPLVGDIEEVLIYSNVSPGQDAAVQNYLTSKYFTPSATLPTLVSATLSATQNTSVTVEFSEPLNPTTATNISNYTISGGVTVTGATMINSSTVVLTTSAIAGGTYALTVNGVSDWAGNSIAANSQISIGDVPAPKLNITLEGSSISISWIGTGYNLQSAATLQGPWSNVSSTSPYVTTPSSKQQFYRLSQ